MSQAQNAKLTVRLADGQVREYELSDAETSIGRDPGCDIQIASQFVSRRHAVVSRSEERFVIQDARSTNGLQINGQIVRDPHTLSPGDRIVLGDVSLTYDDEPADPFATMIYTADADARAPAPPSDAAELHAPAGSRPRTARPSGLYTILFTDLVDHTRTVTRLGDLAGQRWLHRHVGMLEQQFGLYQGVEDKWTGDGFLVTFVSARLAIHCAISIQRTLRDYNRENPGSEMHARIGLNTGEVLREGDELFGNAVILAARVMARAGADEILLSEVMAQMVRSSGEFTITERGAFALKGFPQRQRLYEVKWREEETSPSTAG